MIGQDVSPSTPRRWSRGAETPCQIEGEGRVEALDADFADPSARSAGRLNPRKAQ
jgi:hypothetical protein